MLSDVESGKILYLKINKGNASNNDLNMNNYIKACIVCACLYSVFMSIVQRPRIQL